MVGRGGKNEDGTSKSEERKLRTQSYAITTILAFLYSSYSSFFIH